MTTRKEVLERLAKNEITPKQADDMLASIEAEQKQGGLYCKVSVKGALSVYGLQRMPVTLYVEQWERVLDFAGEIRVFAERHDKELSRLSEAQRRARRRAYEAEKKQMGQAKGKSNSVTEDLRNRERFKALLIRAIDGCEMGWPERSDLSTETLSAIRWAFHTAKDAMDDNPVAIEALEELANGNVDLIRMDESVIGQRG